MSCMILDKHGSAEDNGGSAGQDMASRSGGETALELFGFGPHLMIDGYQANAARLADTELIKRVLAVMPEALVMTKVLPPLVFHYNGTTAEDSGVTGVVIIAESHIAIHACQESYTAQTAQLALAIVISTILHPRFPANSDHVVYDS